MEQAKLYSKDLSVLTTQIAQIRQADVVQTTSYVYFTSGQF